MANLIARIGIYGDIHLSSKNYGAHRDYPNESLNYFRNITKIAEEGRFTHLIGCGDFSFGRFGTLEYRLAVEEELQKQCNLTKGNRYELKGNHDIAGYGMTERDYYIKKGLIKDSTNFSIGNLNISMVDYGCANTANMNIKLASGMVNLAIAHDFYRFSNTNTPQFGQAIILDNMKNWFGLDYLICGHVHKQMTFEGEIENTDKTAKHKLIVDYPGSPSRPSYREGYMDENGQVPIIDIYDDGKIDFNIVEFDLLPLSESFNLEEKAEETKQKEEKEKKVDISDIVQELDAHDRNVGNPEDIIRSMENIDQRYKDKAIDLLERALA